MALRPDQGANTAGVSLSGWSWTPDSRKHDTLDLPVAPRPGEISLLASPGAQIQENLALLVPISSQRREKAAKNLFKRLPKTEPGHNKTQTFVDVAFKLDLECFANGVFVIASARANRGKQQKNTKQKTRLANQHAQDDVVSQRIVKK